LRRAADCFIVCIQSLKLSRLGLFLNFKIVFIKNFLKMAHTRVHFSPGFPPGAGFPGEHVFREFSGAPAVIRTTLEQPHFTFADLFRAGFPGENFFRGFLGAPAAIRATLEQIPHHKILHINRHNS
jgi:hypothetical protein